LGGTSIKQMTMGNGELETREKNLKNGIKGNKTLN
jgi:hypothetical protein